MAVYVVPLTSGQPVKGTAADGSAPLKRVLVGLVEVDDEEVVFSEAEVGRILRDGQIHLRMPR